MPVIVLLLMCMDDTSQNQNQNQTQGQSQVQQPVDPVGTPQKEVEAAPVSDYIVASEIAPIIEKEVAEAGVKEVGKAPELTEEHFKTGIKHAAESTPVQKEPTGAVKLPMTQSEAQQQARGNTDDAATWLANFILRLLKKMRLVNN
ncbi:MAG: hypothetical protein M1444_00825 [Patescibacteria group bacterium]|nr:hypothetical protein [Patescibacteria group bacterium]